MTDNLNIHTLSSGDGRGDCRQIKITERTLSPSVMLQSQQVCVCKKHGGCFFAEINERSAQLVSLLLLFFSVSFSQELMFFQHNFSFQTCFEAFVFHLVIYIV